MTDGITASKYLAQTLDTLGLDAVFFVPTILSRTLYELELGSDIKRIMTHGEKAAAYMADGYSRASGKLGVCMAQTVGSANLAAGLRDPFLARSSVLAITGGPYEWSSGRGTYQEIEDFPLFKSVTKFSERVPSANRLPDLLARAVRNSRAEGGGPVHLEVPGHSGDVFELEVMDDPPEQDVPSWMTIQRGAPDSAVLEKAVNLLIRAARPVIVAGGGVRLSGAIDELRAVAERLDIPVATSLNGKDTFPDSHKLSIGTPGLYSRSSANEALLEADVVFYIGSQTGSQLTLNWTVPGPGTQIVHMDNDSRQLARHFENSIGVLSDAKLGLRAILDLIGNQPVVRQQWSRRVAELGQRWTSRVEPLMASSKAPLRPERLMRELSQHLPPDAVLVSDTGHSGMWTGGFVDLQSDEQRYLRAAGSLGWGLPASIGAQLAVPDRPVVLFTGDGGLWYHLSELETAARWNIPVVVVVNNNVSLNQEIGPYTEAYGGRLHGKHHELWHFRDCDLVQLSESLGVRGAKVSKPSEFGPALEAAIESRRPSLLDVRTDASAMAPRGTAEKAHDAAD